MSGIEFIHYSYREDVGTEMINRPENLEANYPVPPKNKQPSDCRLSPASECQSHMAQQESLFEDIP